MAWRFRQGRAAREGLRHRGCVAVALGEQRQRLLPPGSPLDRGRKFLEVRDLVAQFQGLQPAQHLPDAALKPRHVGKPGRGLRFPGVGRRLSQKVLGGLAKAPASVPARPGHGIRGRGGEAANPFVQRNVRRSRCKAPSSRKALTGAISASTRASRASTASTASRASGASPASPRSDSARSRRAPHAGRSTGSERAL